MMNHPRKGGKGKERERGRKGERGEREREEGREGRGREREISHITTCTHKNVDSVKEAVA